MNTNVLLNDWKNEYPRIVEGKGIYLYDEDGKEYIDGSSGSISNSLGHGREDMAQTIYEQTKKLAYVTRLTSITPIYEKVAHKLAEKTGMDRFFLCSGGSEAVEVATKIALSYQKHRGKPMKNKIIGRWQSYHGCTGHTLSIGGNTARRSDFGAQLVEDGHIAPPLCYHCWYDKKPDTCKCECAKALETEILMRGAENIAGFVFETIGGSTTGAAVPPADYYRQIRKICDKYDILMIADEVMSGAGRTGEMLALDHYGVKPDIVAMAKSIGGGYFPIGAAGCSEKVAKPIKEHGHFMGGYTWGSNPVSCAVILKVMEIMENENLFENVTARGKQLKQGLENLKEKHPIIGDIRGIGLMVCIELVKNRETRESYAPAENVTEKFVLNARKHGLLLNKGAKYNKGASGDGALIGPCFEVTEDEINKIIDRIDIALTDTEKEVM